MFLSHYGVKGQRWGVRNGPPYPIEDKFLRKGTRLNSVSGIKNTSEYINRDRAVYTYNPSDEWDINVYKGAFSTYLKQYKKTPVVYDHEFVVVKDLKMPNKKERIKEFMHIYENNPKTKEEIKDTAKLLAYYNVGGEKIAKEYYDLAYDEITDKKEVERVSYKVFNHMMESSHYYDSTKEYMKIMASKYDAMVDDNNQGVYNEAHDPIVIFRANEAIEPYKHMKVGKPVSDAEITLRTSIVRTEMKKKGKSLLL